MNSNLRLAVLAALATSLTLAQADTFISTATEQDFYVNGAPNFDQRRHGTEVTIQNQQYPLLGLSNDGSEYCGPVAAVEWCDFLANRGYPGLAPGPGDLSGSWTDGVTGLGEYNLVDLSCAIMGAKCQTEPM